MPRAKKASASEVKTSKKDTESGKLMAAISYIWIMGLILLLTEKKNKFVIAHAKQGTAIFVIETILWLIPYTYYISIALFIIGLVGLVFALQEKEIKIQ